MHTIMFILMSPWFPLENSTVIIDRPTKIVMTRVTAKIQTVIQVQCTVQEKIYDIQHFTILVWETVFAACF